MKKVLCIIDVYNWAMHNRVLALQKYLGKEYTYDIKLYSEINNKDLLKKYDIIYSLNWVLHKHIVESLDKKSDRNYKLVTTVCSHGGRDCASDLKEIFSFYDKIGTANMILYNELSSAFKDKIIYTPFGVDTKTFRKETQPYDYLKIYGFVGKTNRPIKRYENIKNAIKITGSNLKTASHTSKLNRNQMCKFYNSVGTVICFSINEGTPNPVLEGAACGRVVISTPVGNVPELFGRSYPLKAVLSESDMVQQIIKLNKDKSLIAACSRHLSLEVQRSWSWKKRIESFKGLLE